MSKTTGNKSLVATTTCQSTPQNWNFNIEFNNQAIRQRSQTFIKMHQRIPSLHTLVFSHIGLFTGPW